MHRIDHTTANATLPTPDAPGTPGYFRKGDPGAGQSATTVTADFANAVQEELAHVITQAGLALSKTDNTQLRQAILKMVQDSNSAVIITGAVFESSVTNGEVVRWDAGNARFDEAIADGTANNQAVGIADVTSSKVYAYGETPALFSGLTPGGKYYLSAATPGAITTDAPTDKVAVGIAKGATVLFMDIAADAVGLPAATNAETAAGLLATVAVTPASLFSTLTKLHNTIGYQRLPNGLIIQWGSGSPAVGGEVYTLAIAFPTAFLHVICSASGQSETANAVAEISGLTGVRLEVTVAAVNVSYLAIGF